MVTKYGYPIEMWDKGKEEMKQILIGRAKIRKSIYYSELVSQIKSIIIEPESYALATMLGEISREEDTAGRGMLSVLVVHKTDGMPGKGFFELAKELGRDISDRTKCWVKELEKVYAFWGTKNE